VQDEKIKAHA